MSDPQALLRRMRAASVFVDPPGALTPLLDALEAVLKLHVAVYSCTDESWHSMETVPCDDCGEWCDCCGEAYPCTTITTIHAALIGDNDE